MTPEIGIGIVGYGFIGKVHAFAHAALPYFYDPIPARTKLVGVCAATEATGAKARAQAGFAFSTTNYRDLLERDDIQVIHCCTPNDAHRDLLIDSLRAEKHLYCDKPLTRTLAEAEEVAALARTVATVQRMTFNYRCVPATLRAKELVREGFLGRVYHFRGQYLHAGYVDPARPMSWRLQMARSGGGAIMDLGAHIVDLLRWLLEDEYAEVSAQLATGIPARRNAKTGAMETVDVDDVAVAQVRMRSGAIGVVEASRLATGVQDELRFEVHGSRGALRFNLMDPNWLDAYDATEPEAPLGGNRGVKRIECATRYPRPYALGATKNTVGWPHFHIASLHDFLDSAARFPETGDKGRPDFDDGLAAQRFVNACQRSAAEQSWVTVES